MIDIPVLKKLPLGLKNFPTHMQWLDRVPQRIHVLLRADKDNENGIW